MAKDQGQNKGRPRSEARRAMKAATTARHKREHIEREKARESKKLKVGSALRGLTRAARRADLTAFRVARHARHRAAQLLTVANYVRVLASLRVH